MKYLMTTLAVSGLLVACTNGEPTANNTSANASAVVSGQAASSVNAKINNPAWQTLRVATEANYPPFQFRDEAGNPVGFEVELLQEVAKAAQLNVDIIHTERKAWKDSLTTGDFDIWSSAFTISDKDTDVADFSQPFIDVENVVYLLDNQQNNSINNTSDLKGKKIAVSKYSKSAPQVVAQLTGSPEFVSPQDTFYLALKSVYAGENTGVFGQDLVLKYYANQQGGNVKVKSINIGEKKKSLAFVVKKGNTDLLKKLNQGLAAVKANGTYDTLVKKYFN